MVRKYLTLFLTIVITLPFLGSGPGTIAQSNGTYEFVLKWPAISEQWVIESPVGCKHDHRQLG